MREKGKEDSVTQVIESVCDEICNHYCKYPDIWDAEKDGELIDTKCIDCPLNRL